MTGSEDTEITLGTGKMLTLFFGLVALCAVFFGMGFSMGKKSVTFPSAEIPLAPASAGRADARPSATKMPNSSASPSEDSAPYKAVARRAADSQSATNNAGNASDANSLADSRPADPATAPPLNGYYVQVAAVSKQEDASALVDALKKKQYPAFAAGGPTDKLFHVQIGPFGDVKEAEGTRTKLVGDGYNPILKK